MASYNRGFAIVGVQYILLAFVLNQSLGIFMNFGAKTPHHRKAPNRYASLYLTALKKKVIIIKETK